MVSNNYLSTFFKSRELEALSLSEVPVDKFIALRMDGKNFKTFTKRFDRPYDNGFINAMNEAALFMMEDSGFSPVLGYVQSDEITIFLKPVSNNNQQIFSGKVSKILSISASYATLGLVKGLKFYQGFPVFDSRITILDNEQEVLDYLKWRSYDAYKNAITMTVSTLYSESELFGLNTSQREELIKGNVYDNLPKGFLYGRLITREKTFQDIEYFDKRTNEMKVSYDVVRSTFNLSVATFSNINKSVEGLL